MAFLTNKLTIPAVSYKRLLEVEAQLRAEVEDLFALSEQLDQREVPDGLMLVLLPH